MENLEFGESMSIRIVKISKIKKLYLFKETHTHPYFDFPFNIFSFVDHQERERGAIKE